MRPTISTRPNKPSNVSKHHNHKEARAVEEGKRRKSTTAMQRASTWTRDGSCVAGWFVCTAAPAHPAAPSHSPDPHAYSHNSVRSHGHTHSHCTQQQQQQHRPAPPPPPPPLPLPVAEWLPPPPPPPRRPSTCRSCSASALTSQHTQERQFETYLVTATRRHASSRRATPVRCEPALISAIDRCGCVACM